MACFYLLSAEIQRDRQKNPSWNFLFSFQQALCLLLIHSSAHTSQNLPFTQHLREKNFFLHHPPFWILKKLHFPDFAELHNQSKYENTVLGKNAQRSLFLIIIYVHSNTDPVILCCLHLSSFRTPEKESISKAVLQKSRGRNQLWAHSKEPLKQPLLKKACTDPDLRDLACQAFIDILSLFFLGPENSWWKELLPLNSPPLR